MHGCDGDHEAAFNWSITGGLQIVNGGGNGDDDITVRATGSGSQTVTLEVSCDGITCHPCEITFNVPVAPVCEIDQPVQDPVCGSTGNTLHVDISGGDAPYDITWSLNSAAQNDNWAITGGQGTSTITYRAGNGVDATFTVTVRDEQGCESQCTIVVSCGQPAPCVDVDAGGPYEQCVPVNCPPNTHCVQLNGTIGGEATSGHWTTSGSGNFLPNANTIDAMYCPSQADLAAGQVTLTLTTNDPEGACGPESDQAVVVILEAPICDIDFPSQNPVCESTGNTLHVDISGGDAPYDITWSINSAGLSDNWAITGGQGTSTITYRAGHGADATFTVTVRDDKGCESQCTITLSCGEAGPCVDVDAGGPYEKCVPADCPPNEHCIQLNGTIGGQATSGHWTTSGSGTFHPNADTIDALYCPSAADLAAGQVTLTLTTNDPAGECGPESDQVVVNLNEGPACTINQPSSSPVCGSTGNTLHVNISGGDAPYTITWSLDSGAQNDDWAITAGQGTSTITYRAGDTGTDATFRVTVRDEQGCESECVLHISCGEGGPCDVDVDAGGPYKECVPDGDSPSQHCVSLNGTIGGLATSGHWTTSGSGSFQPNANTIDAVYCPSSSDINNGQVTLTLTTNDPSGACGPESDQVVVFFKDAPVCDIDDPSQNPVCGSSGNTLHVDISGGDAPYDITWSLNSAALNDNWAITAGQGTSTITYRAGDNNTDATFTVTVRDEQGCESECTLHISCGEGGPCVDVDAGGPYEKCVPEGASPSQHCVQLNGTIGGQATSGTWTTSGSGNFQPNATTIDAVYCPSASDINNGQVTLTLTTNDPAGECGPQSDQVVVFFHDAPVCDIDEPSSNPVCGSTGNTLHVDISGGDTPYTITWSINSAGMADDWAITGGQGTSTITYRAGDTGTDATFTVKVKDEEGCESQCSIFVACGQAAPCPNGPECDIDHPSEDPECESTGNTLHVDISGGNPPYDIDWSIDAGGIADDWAITGGHGTSTITYRAGEGDNDAVFTVRVTDEDDCETTCTITLDCEAEGECPDVCTVTQGYWGNEGGKKCFEGQKLGTLEILEELITPGSPIVLGGGGRSITFGEGTEECIIQLLPGGGTPQALPSNLGNLSVSSGSCDVTGLPLKNGRINNNLLSQALTLALNLRFSSELGDLDLTSSCSSVDLSSTWEDKLDDLGLGTTVNDVLELANRALAGEPVGLSYSAVNDLLSRINEGFEEGCDDCGDDDNEDDDSEVDLLGNEPNPVSITGSTLIRFALNEPSTVHLDVFDVTGRRVATVANGVFPAGESSARFDVAGYPGLSSGIYMYRLTAQVLQTGATYVKAEKMLLIR
ncbi:MAG TPA: T9SS type A sorting domain-containing protein [Candidatus Eisenbacteria bacterium]|nr:T9SS type A sorting domain-containing protein [Candidatus Eisenbacteria bacterium]